MSQETEKPGNTKPSQPITPKKTATPPGTAPKVTPASTAPSKPVSRTTLTAPGAGKTSSNSTTVRQTANQPANNRLRAAKPKRSHTLEIVLGSVLVVLVLGIIIVLLVTSGGKSNKTLPTATSVASNNVANPLTPKNAATIQAIVTALNNGQTIVTAAPVNPTPTGVLANSTTDAQGLNWPVNGGNPARTRVSPDTLKFPMKKLWENNVGGELQSSPAIADGIAYFGSANGSIYAIDIKTSQIKWQRNYASIYSSPAVAGGQVYFGTEAGYVYSLDAQTGKELWSFPTIEQVLSSPVVANGVVYIGSNLGIFWAIDANTGQKKWSAQIGNANGAGINTSPAVADGTVFFGANNGVFYAFQTDNITAASKPKWTVQLPSGEGILSSPAVADGTVYFASEGGKLYAYNVADGSKKWEVGLNGPSRSSPAVANGVVYIGSSDKKVYAFNTKDGSKKWEFATGDAVSSSPAITGDTLLIGSSDTKLYALDLATGQKKWEFATDDIIGSSPAVAGNMVFLTSYDGRIYAFGN